ncbi:hypothetical protein ASPZODRAFT_133646 [Penicilliopsis zonata CBS 506.65]|uniref:Uncharacterized protein n=1 Tax=Penicilliopsis zonata CBS 506.65 TaxID=1073090 RepID=A0A1L9SF07_9EURO|nr:hypothetical protein ASPZODRAFT_133646 [Penicilliopsis zonata CBS 506.65]OJJ45776.1 hypothetical protein ASPZODRAFT_133646 [Penicilliopsis zonata CBS 506.65]
MSGMKGVFKEGWHPKGKDGGRESWRGDFKGINQVAGWVGKGKEKDAGRADHVSRPLSSLKDPASFGPPPKHINYHGPAAVPDQTTPNRRGLGAPLAPEQIERQNAERQQEEEERAAEEAAQKAAVPPLPYRANRTGLTTTNLPPPPVRRVDSPVGSPVESLGTRPRPNVPPRLPARTNSIPSQSPSPPPAYSQTPAPPSRSQSYINENAVNRLTQAGVSVPALGIGSRGSNAASPVSAQAPVNELQSRFTRLRTTESNPPAEGTTLAEKQAAVNTAQKLRSDPSSVSAAEARSAASTANNFRERHNDTIQAGMRKLNGINDKYGITKRFNNFIEEGKAPADSGAAGQPPPPPPHPNRSSSSVDLDALNRRKPPPPPPPPKKSSMRAAPVSPPPPPLPLGTKPR